MLLLAITALAVAARLSLFPIVSADFVECLDVWMNEIRAAQGFHSLGTQVGNYTAPYHYLMAGMSYIPGLDNLWAVKLPSLMADFCMAAAGALVCFQLCGSRTKAMACYAVLLCLPTALLNSAAWGQCDAMYTTLVLLFLLGVLVRRPGAAMLCFGFALSIKLQAIFVLPAILILWLCARLRWRHLLLGVAGYALPFVPAMIAAKSLSPLWRAYAMQTQVGALSSNIPNLPSLLGGFGEGVAPVETTLVLLCIMALGVLALYCWRKGTVPENTTVFLLVAACALLVPFLLPGMKDRYFYLFEVLGVLYAFVRPKRFFVPALMQLAMLPHYMYYLAGTARPGTIWPLACVGACLAAVLYDLVQTAQKKSPV